MAGPNTVNFLAYQDPVAAMRLQQQQALATQLMAGDKPIDPARTAAGGVAIPMSPWEGLANAGKTIAGAYLQKSATDKLAEALTPKPTDTQQSTAEQGALASDPGQYGPTAPQDHAAMLARVMKSGAGSDVEQPTAQEQRLLYLDPGIAAAAYKARQDAYYAKNALTNEQKIAAGLYGEGSSQYNNLMAKYATKATYIDPINARQNNAVLDPISMKPKFVNSAVPDNTTPVYGQRPDGSMGTVGASRMSVSNGAPSAPQQDGGAYPPPLLPANPSNLPSPPPGIDNAPNPQAAAPSTVLPVGPAENAAATEFAKNNATAMSTLNNSVRDSQARQDVLDKIINLSKTTKTGGGAELYNGIKNTVTGLPVVGDLAEKLTGSSTDFQELTKYLQQNAIRSWQAAGGSGTDAQLDAQLKANPNNKMTPQALRAMAEFTKAGELASTAKANYMNSQIGPNNENIAKVNQIEQQWKQNFDPKVYQLSVAQGDPSAMASVTKGMSERHLKALTAKYMHAKQAGFIQ